MIIYKLVEQYERLLKEGYPKLVKPGYKEHNIKGIVEFDSKGKFLTFVDCTKNKQRLRMVLPRTGEKHSNGCNPYYVADNFGYALGYKIKSIPRKEKKKETGGKGEFDNFYKFRDDHLEYKEAINHPSFDAFCAFLENWDPETIPQELQDAFEATKGGEVAFKMKNDKCYLHDIPEIQAYWYETFYTAFVNQGTQGVCTITGNTGTIGENNQPFISVINTDGEIDT